MTTEKDKIIGALRAANAIQKSFAQSDRLSMERYSAALHGVQAEIALLKTECETLSSDRYRMQTRAENAEAECVRLRRRVQWFKEIHESKGGGL